MKYVRVTTARGSVVALFLLAGSIPAIWGGDWPMWRHDAARSAYTSDALPTTLELQWVLELPPLEKAWPNEPRITFDEAYSPVVVGNTMYISSSFFDSIRAYDTETATELWCFYTNGPARLAPVVDNGHVYCATDDGYLYCLDGSTGELVWKFKAAPSSRKCIGNKRLCSVWPARGGPVIINTTVYVSAGIWPFMGVFVYALDAGTGDVIWRNDGSGAIYMDQPHSGAVAFSGIAPQGYLTVSGNTLLVPNGRAPAAALDRTTGELLYFRHSENHREATAHVAAVGSYFNNCNQLMNLGDGSVVTGGLANGAVLTSDTAYVGSIEAINIPALTSKWTYAASGYKPYCKAGSYVYAGKTDGIIAIEDTGSSGVERWSKTIVGTPADMIAADDKLIVSTVEGYIYCFGVDTGASLPAPTTIFAAGDDWKYFKGTSFPGSDWNTIGFNDNAWLTGPSGIGYGDGDDATVLSDMENNYITVYMRKTFTVTDPDLVSGLNFTVDYDDGFVAFVNGTEVLRLSLIHI